MIKKVIKTTVIKLKSKKANFRNFMFKKRF